MVTAMAGGGAPSRFRRARSLGRVLWGEVHLAEQTGEGGVVKRVRVWGVRPELCRQAAALAMLEEDLQRAGKLSPYAIAQLLDVWREDGAEGGLWFATEHLEGLTLREAMSEAFFKGRDLSAVAVAAIALEVARALEYAHDRTSRARGLVHGDLRPEYVLLGLEGGVKLVGFGLARFLQAVYPSGEWCHWKGACYQPPERLEGEPESAGADLYALGLLILEALCYEPELSGEGLEELRARLEAGAPVESAGGDPLPPDLARVVARACASRPRERYLTATQMATDLHLLLLERRVVRPTASVVREVVADLAPPPDRERTLTNLSAQVVDPDRGGDRVTLPDLPLVGREAVLEQISRALERAAAGHGQVIAIRGEAGMGRTRILNEVALRLAGAGHGHAWIQVASSQLDQGAPYSGALKLLAAAMGLKPDADLVRVGEEAHRLRALGVEPDAVAAVRAVLGLEPARDPLRLGGLIGEAVYKSVASLAWEQATVVAWDDLQWIDQASLGCVLDLLSRFEVLPAVALLTVTRDLRAPWSLPEGSALIDLGPLEPADCERIVVQMGWGRAVDPALLGRLVAHTGGCPQRLVETVDLLSGEDRLEVVEGAARLRGDPEGRLPRLEDSIREHVSALDDDSALVAVTAAVAGPALDPALVSAATGIPADVVLRLLDELSDVGGLLRRTGRGFEVRNDRVCAAAIAAVGPGLALTARQWMARAILAREGEPAPGLDDHAAALLAETGDARGAAVVLAGAARRQESRGDLRGAAERYARALQLSRSSPGALAPHDELELCMAAGRVSVHSLSLDLGEWVVHRAIEIADALADARAAAEARVLLCRLLTRKGQLPSALDRVREAMPLARRSGDPLTFAQVSAAVAECYQQNGNFGPDMEYLEAALRIATDTGDLERIGEYLQLAVIHALGVGEYARTRELIERARGIARDRNDPLLSCQLLKAEGVLERFGGDNEKALRINLEGVALAHAQGLEEQEIIMLHNCGDNHLALERQREALYFYSESLRRSSATHYDRLTEANSMFVGFLEITFLGVESGFDRLMAAVSSAERSSRFWNLTQGHRLLGQAHLLASGNRESAVYHLREAVRIAERTGVRFFIEQASRWLAQALQRPEPADS